MVTKISAVLAVRNEDILKTLEFVKMPGVQHYQIALLTPLPGTALWKHALSKGLVSNDMDWSKLSLEVTDKNIHSKVIVCENVSGEEIWELIKKHIKQAKQTQLEGIKIDLRNSWKEYVKKTIKQPQKYVPLIKGVILAKIKAPFQSV